MGQTTSSPGCPTYTSNEFDHATHKKHKANDVEDNKLINYLLHYGGFSTNVVEEITKMVSIKEMASVVSTCHELNNADLKLYEAPHEWNDGDDVRKIFTIMISLGDAAEASNLMAFYQMYYSSKATQKFVARKLNKHRGREERMFQKLFKFYNVLPNAQEQFNVPTTKWIGRIDTSKVTKLMLGEKMKHNKQSKTKIVTDEMLRLVASGKFPLLTSLDLSGCNNITETGLMDLIYGLDANTHTFDTQLKHLTSLNFSFCHWITDVSVTALSYRCPNLISLNLHCCNKITDRSIILLSNGCPQLTTVDLQQCVNITNDSIYALSIGCPKLTTLNLYFCDKITNDSIIALSNGCPHLIDLNLGVNDMISNASIIALSIGCPKLTTLNLCYCSKITDASIIALSNGCSKLSTINLRYCNQITDASIIALSQGCPHLISLNIRDCDDITNNSVNVLRQSHPQIKIEPVMLV
jgi:hypothetical protein